MTVIPEILPPEINYKQGLELKTKSSSQESVEDLLYEFLQDRSPTTARSYKTDVKEFFRFTSKYFQVPRVDTDRQVRFEDIKRVHAVKYKNFLENYRTKQEQPYAPNSINRKISSSASFFKFLQQREVIDKNPFDFVKRLERINIRDTECFNDEETKAFFKLVIRRAPELHRAALLFLFTSGIRNHELRKIKLKDFENRNGVKVFHYVGKGKKQNTMPVHPVAGYHIGKYLEHMENIGRPIGPNDYLFQASKVSNPSMKNQMLSHSALGYIVKKWSRQINMKKRITPHSARAGVITSLLEQGEDIYAVAQMIGHSRTYVSS